MTFFRLPNLYSASISEGTFNAAGFEYRFRVYIKNACGEVEETLYVDTLEETMQILAEY